MMVSRSASFLAGIVLVGTCAALALGDEGEMPDPTLTPGVVASIDAGEVCGRGSLTYSQAHRQTTREMKLEVIHAYGLTPPFRGEIDHRIPLCLGGADDVRNLWPQRDFQAKDRLETFACREVCAGRVSITEAQGWFLGDWRQQLGRVR